MFVVGDVDVLQHTLAKYPQLDTECDPQRPGLCSFHPGGTEWVRQKAATEIRIRALDNVGQWTTRRSADAGPTLTMPRFYDVMHLSCLNALILR